MKISKSVIFRTGIFASTLSLASMLIPGVVIPLSVVLLSALIFGALVSWNPLDNEKSLVMKKKLVAMKKKYPVIAKEISSAVLFSVILGPILLALGLAMAISSMHGFAVLFLLLWAVNLSLLVYSFFNIMLKYKREWLEFFPEDQEAFDILEN